MTWPSGVVSVPPMTSMPVEIAEPAVIEPDLVDPELDEAISTDKPWIVIVWNDPVNLMSYVVYVLQELFGYSREKATRLMLAVHHEGKAVVADGTREQCEGHVGRLHGRGLWATMEHPA